MDSSRQYSTFDRFILGLDQALATAFGRPVAAARPYPAEGETDDALSERERCHAAGLMRVDHAGEVAAQAMYQGQGVSAGDAEVRASMHKAASGEIDHLAWCEQRLAELDSHSSYLNPLWYAGAFAIGTCAGALGDKWSLGFVAETERQVVRHLDRHLEYLPGEDQRSRAILKQMREDEAGHAAAALEAGAQELPRPVKRLMALCAKVMTGTAYYL